MNVFIPEYYNHFRCIASRCPDSCCKEWDVDVDPETAARYRALPGALGDRLRQVLQDTPDGTVMTIESGRCPMWRQDGLCRIQAELGHDALCTVCRQFPRLHHDYGDFIELGLELSCPEAARLILTSPEQALLTQTLPGGETPEYDTQVMACLRQSRAAALTFLDAGDYSIPETLAILLLYAHEVQSQIDGGELATLAPEQTLYHAKQLAQPATMVSIFDFFKNLEILTPQWRSRLDAGPVRGNWENSIRALARYFICRYWLQAVSDFDLVCRVKLLVIACLLVRSLGGNTVQTAQQFSKEIENDPDNVDAILDAAYTSPAFTDTALLGLLLK